MSVPDIPYEVLNLGINDLQDHKKLEILRSQIEGFKVSDVLNTEYPVLSPEDRVKDALAAMKKSGFQDVPVVEDGNYEELIALGGRFADLVERQRLDTEPRENGSAEKA